ncbi:hypothetical protein [Mycobacterium heckeshornense]|uniref:hypothetical protein n=1 Tax=Mycobacterium heckeshornense TaxID=110505 RepID=UPI000AB9442A|nr:hypothetical protein [Mycobacterium heckeshornense]
MSTARFTPGPRKMPPGVVSGSRIMTPTSLDPLIAPRPIPRTKLQIILPAVIGVAFIGMMALIFSQPGLRSGPMVGLSLFFPLMMISSMAMMFSGNRFGGGGDNKSLTPAQMEIARREYLKDLDDLRDEVHESARAQFEQFRFLHPEPTLLLGAVGSDRMWERSRKVGGGGR